TASSELTATPRTITGKSAHRLAAKGKIPAVLYGPGRDAMPIELDRHDFELFAAHHSSGGILVELKIDGAKPVNAMMREVQHSSVKGTILHVDFVEVAMNKPVHALITLHLVNDPEGVKSGGVLTTNLHEVNVEAKPGDLPEAIEVDVAGLGVGDSLHVSDIVAPKGVTVLDDLELVVASVQAPRAEVEEEFAEEAAEPEVIGAKSESEE
ncbi:MAG: 50S ribosomal protein L25, partial [Actinobacteria bacterium]